MDVIQRIDNIMKERGWSYYKLSIESVLSSSYHNKYIQKKYCAVDYNARGNLQCFWDYPFPVLCRRRGFRTALT